MIISVGDWPQLHEAVAGELATSECKSVLVFVSGADVDAVAAARTLKAHPGAEFAPSCCLWVVAQTWRDLRPRPPGCVVAILQDAACAASAKDPAFTSKPMWSLQDIFENTGAHFSVFPVVNYEQVKAHCQSLVDGEVRCGLWPAPSARGPYVSAARVVAGNVFAT